MAVCNLFSQLSSTSGNFMMFSQYVEDVTANYTNGDNHKVVPTGFVAMNIDYTSLKANSNFVNKVLNHESDINKGIPKYFQNCFENACAYAKNTYPDTWNPNISRNLFWNFMFDGNFTTVANYDSNAKYIPEVVYYGDVNMHAYNKHKGMGYGEIYCYIPTDAGKMNCQVIQNDGGAHDTSNSSMYLEGFDGDESKRIDGYSMSYCYEPKYSMPFDSELSHLQNSSDTKYGINTIVVLYSVFSKLNDEWEPLYSNIPMGIYFAGKFNDDGSLTNTVTKYVSTSYDCGTSYGLRICTRFSATGNGLLTNTEVEADGTDYTNVCQLMSSMNANVNKMLEISRSAIDTTQQYKDLLSIIRNNRTNVPYIKEINGENYWFVNGRLVGKVDINVNIDANDCTCDDIPDLYFASHEEVIGALYK